MEFDVIIEKDEDNVYVASVPELPGCHTQGSTAEEVLKHIKEAIELYLEVMKNKEIQEDKMKLIAVHRVSVSV